MKTTIKKRKLLKDGATRRFRSVKLFRKDSYATQSYFHKNRHFFQIITETNMFHKQILNHVKNIIDFFFLSIRLRVNTLPYPLVYNDFAKRSEGRYEIVPPPDLAKQIFQCLQKSDRFCQIRKKIHDVIGYGTTEELCLLPVEPGAPVGKWHRDVFYYNTKIAPYYITQLIYLDPIVGSKTKFKKEDGTSHLVLNKDIQTILFDGRLCHQGEPNNTNQIRYALYISYMAAWYKDEESSLSDSFFRKT